MTLNTEFMRFCDRWINKANTYDNSLYGCYDKFFTFFVVYNALYTETEALLGRKAKAREGSKPRKLYDKTAATQGVLDFLGSEVLITSLEENAETKRAVERLISNIEEHFNIHLDRHSGDPLLKEDKELLVSLKSTDTQTKAHAILTAIYQIRCNMFHGRKGLEPVQRLLLEPLIVILKAVVRLLYEKLIDEPYV